MKKEFLLLILGFCLFFYGEKATIKVTRLSCEMLIDPRGIDCRYDV
jgi:hypothetical protein